jgi:hypothetical protein
MRRKLGSDLIQLIKLKFWTSLDAGGTIEVEEMKFEKMIVLIFYDVIIFINNRVRRVGGGEINKFPVISNDITQVR